MWSLPLCLTSRPCVSLCLDDIEIRAIDRLQFCSEHAKDLRRHHQIEAELVICDGLVAPDGPTVLMRAPDARLGLIPPILGSLVFREEFIPKTFPIFNPCSPEESMLN